MNITVDSTLTLKPEKALNYWEGKVPALKSQLHRLSEEAKTRAFVVSRLNSMKQLQQIYDGIESAMKDGKPLATAVRELEKQNIQLSTAHLRTAVNTNLKSAYSAGRWEQIQASKEIRPFLEYLAVIDDRSTIDQLYNGVILPVDDPFWQVNMPPNHHNCRCDVRSLSQNQVDRLSEKLGRDPVTHTEHPVPINKDFAGIPGQPYQVDLSGYQQSLRDGFLSDMANHFARLPDGRSQIARYLNSRDAQQVLKLMEDNPQ